MNSKTFQVVAVLVSLLRVDAAHADPSTLAQRVADLGSADSETRAKAAAELSRLGSESDRKEAVKNIDERFQECPSDDPCHDPRFVYNGILVLANLAKAGELNAWDALVRIQKGASKSDEAFFAGLYRPLPTSTTPSKAELVAFLKAQLAPLTPSRSWNRSRVAKIAVSSMKAGRFELFWVFRAHSDGAIMRTVTGALYVFNASGQLVAFDSRNGETAAGILKGDKAPLLVEQGMSPELGDLWHEELEVRRLPDLKSICTISLSQSGDFTDEVDAVSKLKPDEAAIRFAKITATACSPLNAAPVKGLQVRIKAH